MTNLNSSSHPAPMKVSLLRVASSLGIFKLREPAPPCQTGWNGLPEDVFHIILKEHLQSNIPSAKALSTSCKSYAKFSRSYIFRAIEIAGPKAVKELNTIFVHHPWVIDLVQTLRITDADKQMSLQGRGKDAPLKPAGKALLSILSHRFPQLNSFELPLLHGRHQWSSLSKQLQEAICTFVSHHELQEVSITTHYPLEILSACPTLRKLEYRIYPDTGPPTMVPTKESSSVVDSGPAVTLQELVIQDPSNLASAFLPYLVHATLCVDLKQLETLCYYGDNAPVKELPVLLDHCSSSLSTLSIFVNGSGEHFARF